MSWEPQDTMLISNSNVSLVCTLHMKTVKNFSIIPKSEKTKMKEETLSRGT